MSGLTGYKRAVTAEAVDRLRRASENALNLAEVAEPGATAALYMLGAAVLSGFSQLCGVAAACGEDLEDAIGRLSDDRRAG